MERSRLALNSHQFFLLIACLEYHRTCHNVLWSSNNDEKDETIDPIFRIITISYKTLKIMMEG